MEKFYFITTFCNFNSDKTNKEIIYSINENLKNELIGKLFLLIDLGLPDENMYEKFIDSSNLSEYQKYLNKEFIDLLQNEKVNIYIIKTRPTYKYIFNFCNNFCYVKWILSNADINFPIWNMDRLKLLLNKDFSKEAFVLTRYNILEDLDEPWKSGKIDGKYYPWLNGIEIEHNNIAYKSQNVNGCSIDSWIFQSPFNILSIDLDFEMGQPECDGRMNYQLQKVRKVTNPCIDIISIHKHLNWNANEYQIVKYNNTKFDRKVLNEIYKKKNYEISFIRITNLE